MDKKESTNTPSSYTTFVFVDMTTTVRKTEGENGSIRIVAEKTFSEAISPAVVDYFS